MHKFNVRFLQKGIVEHSVYVEAYDEVRALCSALDTLKLCLWLIERCVR